VAALETRLASLEARVARHSEAHARRSMGQHTSKWRVMVRDRLAKLEDAVFHGC
jgi:hypothetical protein